MKIVWKRGKPSCISKSNPDNSTNVCNTVLILIIRLNQITSRFRVTMCVYNINYSELIISIELDIKQKCQTKTSRITIR